MNASYHQKTYLEIQVPIYNNAAWMSYLKESLWDVPVKWQNGYYHVTVAFIDSTPYGVDVSAVLDERLKCLKAPSLMFDSLGAFTIPSGSMHIVYLTSQHPIEELLRLIESIRMVLSDAGCIIQTDFKLHVTLGRILSSEIGMASLQHRISEVKIPAFELCLTDAEHRVFRGRTIKHWTFPKH